MKRFAFLLYGIIAYFAFFGTILYAIGFIGNLFVPKSIDGVVEVSFIHALFNNLALLLAFGVQHSVMARASFKRWWTKIIPETIERSTYVLISSIMLSLVMWLWEPMGGVVWALEDGILKGIFYALFGLGWAILFASSFLINHFDLFGLRQVWLNFRKQPYTELPFNTPSLYKIVRHPLYFGFMMAFWLTPTMTLAHLVFALGCTGYILVGIQLEERDLINHFGERYLSYKSKVPMLIPFLKSRKSRDKGFDLQTQKA